MARIGMSGKNWRGSKSVLISWAISMGIVASPAVWAQTDEVLAEERRAQVSTEELTPVTENEERPTGFTPRLALSANFSWVHSDNVVGALDGHNITLGYIVSGGNIFLSENRLHEWQTALLWQLGLVRTPAFDDFIKNTDLIDFRTAYLYHLPSVKWLGRFSI